MSTPVPAKKPSQEFDEAKLEQMTEPITVNVDKIIAGKPQPVELPVKPGETVAGKGWSKDDVRTLSEFLGRKRVGAGLVNVKITDANGVAMKWQWIFSQQDYPPLAPAVGDQLGETVAGAVPGVMPIGGGTMPMIAQSPVVGTVPNMPAVYDPYSGWLASVPAQPARVPQNGVPGGYLPLGQYGRPASPLAPPQPLGAPMYPSYPIFTPPPPIAAPGSDERFQKEREERIKLEQKIERKDLEQNYDRNIGAVTNEVRQLQAAVAQMAQGGARSNEESETVRSLKEQLAEMQRRHEQQSQQNQFTAALQQMRADTDKQILAITQLIKESQKPAVDPMIQLMMQQQQAQQAQQLEYMKLQMSMMQQHSGDKLTPMQMFEMLTRMNQGSEQQHSAYTKAWEMLMQGVDTILAAQGPQMHPALEMLGQGIQAAAGIGQKFVEQKEEVGKMQAMAQNNQAQAQMHLANQLALARQQQQQLAAPAQPAPAQPPAEAAPPDGGEGDEGDEGDDENAPSDDGAVTPQRMDEGALAERQKMDKEAFGPALDSIQRLRKGVAAGALDVEQTTVAIVKGVEEFLRRRQKNPQIVVPAFDLWTQGRIAELLDLMLPEAKSSFKDQIEQTLIAMVQKMREEQAAAAAAAPPKEGAKRGKK